MKKAPARARKTPNRAWWRRSRYTDTTLLITVAVALLVYSQIILPNKQASQYEQRMIRVSNNMQDCASELAGTTKLPLFAAPDVSLAQKQTSLETIKEISQRCDVQLQDFNRTAQSLQDLRFSGFTNRYQTAHGMRSHAMDIAGQSSDVLSHYSELADFLSQYFGLLGTFVDSTGALNQLSDTNSLGGRTDELAKQASDLRQQASSLRQLKPVTGFQDIVLPTALMLDEAAYGFETLTSGYRANDTGLITAGFQSIEQAVAQYDKTVKNLPFEKLQKSYTVKQASSLAVKFNDLKSDVAY